MSTVMAGVQVLPNGKDMNTNGILPKLVEEIEESGLKFEVGPMETVIEGSMDEVMELLIKLQGKAVSLGSNEVITNIRLHYRPEGIDLSDKQH
ncbi:thiamine-binding protein [Evansella tamaricis]|uniref:Thiamine-binding protein n=1 Tax=Evansella tamaricis TaxID=2069301 RepID=A0ABS6JK39_9BACI|nr:thiamine-binding protein [Evansella tamaricis]MBU9714040.1 thiamine-binding protein [Evansella tamaricis]